MMPGAVKVVLLENVLGDGWNGFETPKTQGKLFFKVSVI